MDYEKLTNDLKQALAAAKAVTQEDVGYFNLDTPYIKLDGNVEPEQVKAAAKVAGMGCRHDYYIDGKYVGDTYYFFGMTGNQARRTAEAEAIAYTLAKLGYKAGIEYMTD